MRTTSKTMAARAIQIAETLLAGFFRDVTLVSVGVACPSLSRLAGAADRPLAADRIIRIPTVFIPKTTFAHALANKRTSEQGARV